jgi:hypothetical protein
MWQITLQRSAELRWQRDVIEKWLNTPGIPLDAHSGLLEMLKGVKEEMADLAAIRSHFDDRTNRQAS